jgi:Protein of unknown function (DUF3017)
VAQGTGLADRDETVGDRRCQDRDMAEQYESREPIRGPHVPEPRSHEGGPAGGRPRRDEYLDAESGDGSYGVPHPAAPPGDDPYEPHRVPPHPGASQPVPGPTTPPARGAERVRGRSSVPRWLGRLPYAFVLCGVAAGLAVVATNHFRRGSMLIAASVFIGALARLLLPESQVGMLAVRRRWLDVLLMTATAVGITLVAFVAKGTSG